MAKKKEPTTFNVRFWGVRGSIPCPGRETQKFGGNTSCVEVTADDVVCIIDAGTGIRELGIDIQKNRKIKKVHLFITHTHWDHIQGLPFFTPVYRPDFEIHVYGPRPLDGSLEDCVLNQQLQYKYFPVRGVEIGAKVVFHELDQEAVVLGDVEVSTKPMNHPIRVLAFKLTRRGKSVVYSGDNEPYYDLFVDAARIPDTQFIARSQFIRQCQDNVVDFVRGTDLLIADAQYTDEEYAGKRGWGHSSVSHVLDLALAGGVKNVALFHHEPTHTDGELLRIEKESRARMGAKKGRPNVFMAREGTTFTI